MKRINKKIIAIILAVILAGSGSGYLIYSYVNGNLFNPDSVSNTEDTKKNKVDFDDKVDKVDDKNEEEKKPDENKTENSQKNKDKKASAQNIIKSRGNIYVTTPVKSNNVVYNNIPSNISNGTAGKNGTTNIIGNDSNSNTTANGAGNSGSGNNNNSGNNGNSGGNSSSGDDETPAKVIKPSINHVKEPTKDAAKDAWDDMGWSLPSYDKNNSDNATKTLNLHIEVATDDIMNAQVRFYKGEVLNDENILKQVNAYALPIDESGDYNYWSGYKLREFNDNFYVKDYPEKAYDGFKATFCFRATSISPWQEETVSFPVVDRKLVVLTYQDGIFANYNDTVKKLFPEENEKIDLLNYYGSFFKNNEELSMLFRGFTDTLDGEPINNTFICKNEGITFLYPAGYVELDTSRYKARMETRIDNIMLGIEYLQTLYDYTATASTLKVPQYIYQLKFDSCHSFDRVVIPDTLKVFSLVNKDGEQTLDVKNEYIVSKDNQYYSTLNGMLTSKEQDKVYAIPTSMTKLTFDESIKSITISKNSGIKEIHLSSTIPEMDIENLSGAKIYVPANAYFDYLNAWGGKLGNNELLNEDESKSPYVYSNGAVYSQDMTTLYSITSDVSGIFIVPESVKTIATGAMANCPNVDTLIFLSNIDKIEDKSINSEQLTRIYMLGKDSTTSINENVFINSENLTAPVVYVQSSLYNEYVDLWSTTMGEIFTSVLEKDELEIKYINGNVILKSINGSILLKGADAEDFDSNTLPIDIMEIGANAFKNNNYIKNVNLGESVQIIGKSAFYNAQNLETVYSERTDDIHVEANSFFKVTNLKYAAFNAEIGYVDDDFSDNPVSYKFYGPYNAYGYRNYIFDYETAYGTPYEVVDTNDGKILYAFNEYVGTDGGYVLCAATRSINGNVTLKDNTLLICDYAFNECANEFKIKNYEDIINIGEKSFASSGIAGKYDFESLTYIRTNAFAGCKNLTQLEFGQSFYMCYSNIVSECPNLKKIIIKSPMVPSLSNLDPGKSYSFGENVGTECGGFKIELQGNADVDEYIDKWKYAFVGKDSFYDYGTLTEEEDIKAQNLVRALFGMSLLEYKVPNENETPNTPNTQNENNQNNSNSSAEKEDAENVALNNQNENETELQPNDEKADNNDLSADTVSTEAYPQIEE